MLELPRVIKEATRPELIKTVICYKNIFVTAAKTITVYTGFRRSLRQSV